MNLDDDVKWVMEHFLIPNLMDLKCSDNMSDSKDMKVLEMSKIHDRTVRFVQSLENMG